jgi:hypothetical protein
VTALIIFWIVASAAAVLALVVLTLLSGPGHTTQGGKSSSDPGDNPLVAGRTSLISQTDLPSCQRALQQFNNHLSQAPDEAPAPLTDEQQARLRELFGLDDDSLREVRSATFTTLDASYLAGSFLFRDAAVSLELPSVASKGGGPRIAQTALDRAAAAFAWVMRQVRVQSPTGVPLPPLYALRRGWGTELDRALVFLAVLEQLTTEEGQPLEGCLVFCSESDRLRLWACGVAIGEKPNGLYLFDPRIGLPLPGPGGKGIATLAQVRSDPAVLEQLRFEKLPYDVTAEQAKSAQVQLVCSLSSLAPRMSVLQGPLLREPERQRKPDGEREPLPPPVRVSLARNFEQSLARLQQAAGAGKESTVGIFKPGTFLLRRFLPREEGGAGAGVKFFFRQLRGFTTDKDPTSREVPRAVVYQWELAPWEQFPERFRDPDDPVFRYDIEGVGQRLRNLYAGPFFRSVLEPGSARDLMLRGLFTRAMPLMMRDLDQWRQMKQRRAVAENLDSDVDEWVKRVKDAYIQEVNAKTEDEKMQARQAMTEVWKRSDAVQILLTGAMADPWTTELTYLLGLCTYERADRLQGRLTLAEKARGESPGERDKAREAWEVTQTWWRDYAGLTWPHSGRANAVRLRAQTQAALGERDEAIRTLEDEAVPMTGLEKLGARLRARQLRGERP